jgi:transcriptional regulator with XRE-family HTH domain
MPDSEQAARLRAAFAYGGLDKDDRAEVLGVSPRTVTRYQTIGVALSPSQRERVIEATGVPAWFLDSGFEAPPEPEEPTVRERVEALEAKIDGFLRAVREARDRSETARVGDDLIAIADEYLDDDAKPGADKPAQGARPAGHTSEPPAVRPADAAPTGGYR